MVMRRHLRPHARPEHCSGRLCFPGVSPGGAFQDHHQAGTGRPCPRHAHDHKLATFGLDQDLAKILPGLDPGAWKFPQVKAHTDYCAHGARGSLPWRYTMTDTGPTIRPVTLPDGSPVFGAIVPGMRNAGYVILAVVPTSDKYRRFGNGAEYTVTALDTYQTPGTETQAVTWRAGIQDDGRPAYWLGHYFRGDNAVRDALRDMIARTDWQDANRPANCDH